MNNKITYLVYKYIGNIEPIRLKNGRLQRPYKYIKNKTELWLEILAFFTVIYTYHIINIRMKVPMLKFVWQLCFFIVAFALLLELRENLFFWGKDYEKKLKKIRR